MNKLVARQRLVMTFTFFSMFFGAGNLFFPPFVGAQAGSATIPAAIGFIVSAVGLPILGVLAVTFAGGFDKLASRVSPQIRLVPRRGDHAHHRPVLCDSTYGDHLIRNDGGSFRTVLLWLAGPTHLLARVLHTGVPVRPASRETLQSARPIHGAVAAGAHCCPVHRLPDPRHRHPGQPDGRLLHKPDRTRLPRRLPDHGPARRALLRHRDLREYPRPTSR